jgi:hypothetical protein
MTSILKVDTIQDTAGNNIINESSDTITIGASGDTITIPAGATISNLGTATGFGVNTPAFEAYLSSATAISHNTSTKVPCNIEIYDTDSCYDNVTNYRFTPLVAGKYYFYFTLRGFAGGSDPDGVRFLIIRPYKNGSDILTANGTDYDGNEPRAPQMTFSTVVNMNGTTDYVEFYATIYAENLSSSGVELLNNFTSFGAYRIIE